MRSSSRLRRTLGTGVAALVLLLLAGATVQGVLTAIEQREFPRPGGLVGVGDHQLHISCTGSASPTVVLEAPALGFSAAWAPVQERLSAVTRVCSYDRAGLGWSERGPLFDPAQVPVELRTLLSRANEKGPYVVVGHGLGAAFARLYAARADGDAAALVLIDDPSPHATDRGNDWLVPASPWLARAGVLRAGRLLSSKAGGLLQNGALSAFLNRPDHLSRGAEEIDRWNETITLAQSAPLAGGIRVVTVDLGTRDRISFLTTDADVTRIVRAIEGVLSPPAAP